MFDPGDPCVRLDGGVATELERAGVPVTAPWWTTSALLSEQRRRVLRTVHADYLASGAQVITANTFRCNIRTLRAIGRIDSAGLAWMVHAAVGVALAARRDVGAGGALAAGNGAGHGAALIAGSIGPVEDCYRPDLVPSSAELRDEHHWLATELLRAGVDVILIETMNTQREARIALEQALAVGGRAWVSFACGHDGRLLSGEPVARAVAMVASDGAEAVLVNCTSLVNTDTALREIREVYPGPLGAYPNIERRSLSGGHRAATEVTPEEFATALVRWREQFALALLGGCCGTQPVHIGALRTRLQDGCAAAGARFVGAPANGMGSAAPNADE
jgi:S-methylmethionine-dependent homocysteine/selenocysteine methylase